MGLKQIFCVLERDAQRLNLRKKFTAQFFVVQRCVRVEVATGLVSLKEALDTGLQRNCIFYPRFDKVEGLQKVDWHDPSLFQEFLKLL